jgi:CBS domain-containing protein
MDDRMNYGRGGGSYARERDYGDENYSYGNRYSGERDHERDDYGRSAYGGSYNDRNDYREYRYEDARYGRGGSGSDRSFYDEGRARQRSGATRSHVRCRDIMTRDVTVANRDTVLQDVAAMMRDEDTGVIPVVEPQTVTTQTTDNTANNTTNATDAQRRGNGRMKVNGKLVGLITDRDIVVRAIAEGRDAHTTRAEEVMTSDVHTASPNDRVIDAIRKMGDKQVRRIPVVDENKNLLGIISMADVALETEEDRELAEALEEISSGSSFWSKIFG